MGSHRVADYADMLGGVITPSQKKAWAKGTPEAWANESHRAAVETAYRDVPADGPPPRLDKKYIDRARPGRGRAAQEGRGAAGEDAE